MDVKKIKGRKPHIAVDTMGNLPGVIVHAANLHDTVSGLYPAAYASTVYPSIQGYSADAGYRGTFVDEVQEVLSTRVDIVGRPHTQPIEHFQNENALKIGNLSILPL